MQIFIKTLDGRSRAFEVGSDMKVKVLKSLIEEKEGIPENQQRLLFMGKQLEDDVVLGEYGIGANSTIHFVMFLKG